MLNYVGVSVCGVWCIVHRDLCRKQSSQCKCKRAAEDLTGRKGVKLVLHPRFGATKNLSCLILFLHAIKMICGKIHTCLSVFGALWRSIIPNAIQAAGYGRLAARVASSLLMVFSLFRLAARGPFYQNYQYLQAYYFRISKLPYIFGGRGHFPLYHPPFSSAESSCPEFHM